MSDGISRAFCSWVRKAGSRVVEGDAVVVGAAVVVAAALLDFLELLEQAERATAAATTRPVAAIREGLMP
jgi:hypothetical protein